MKTIKELEVRLENKPGKLSEVSELLGANGINILAMTVHAEGDEGLLKFVSSDPVRSLNVLTGSGFDATLKEILAVETPNHPGGLNAILKPLRIAGVNVEQVYSCIDCVGSGDKAIMILGADDLSAAAQVLSSEWIQLHGEELYKL